MIKGFKCFHSGLANAYGRKFELHKPYYSDNVSYGVNNKGGFHFCTRMEDTFRFYDAFTEKVDVCEITATGKIIKGPDDDYNGYYDSYVASEIMLDKLLNYEEIIAYADRLDNVRFKRFISLYRVQETELEYFKKKYCNNCLVMNTINYYYKQR